MNPGARPAHGPAAEGHRPLFVTFEMTSFRSEHGEATQAESTMVRRVALRNESVRTPPPRWTWVAVLMAMAATGRMRADDTGRPNELRLLPRASALDGPPSPPDSESRTGRGSEWESNPVVVDETWTDCVEPAGVGYTTWAELDYLLWRRSNQPVPILVTTDPDDGVLPNATTLFGGGRVGDDTRPGGRLRFGSWLNGGTCEGVEAGIMMLGNGAWHYAVDSSTITTIARPFYNYTDDLQGGYLGEDSLLVALAGTSTGGIEIDGDSNILSADVGLRRVITESCRLRLDGLVGYQMARIDESVRIRSATSLVSSDTTIEITDLFDARNEFHGAYLGLELQRDFGRASIDLLGRIALGNMRQTVMIDGEQVSTVGGVASVAGNGLFAQSTNIGRYTRSEFAIAPEAGLHVGYRLSSGLFARAGYSCMYWNHVAKPGDHMDRGINPNQPPPAGEPQRPAFAFVDGDLLLHGLDFGLVWTY